MALIVLSLNKQSYKAIVQILFHYHTLKFSYFRKNYLIILPFNLFIINNCNAIIYRTLKGTISTPLKGVTIFIDDEILALKPAETCPEPGGSDSKDNAFPIGPCLLSASLFHLEFLPL